MIKAYFQVRLTFKYILVARNWWLIFKVGLLLRQAYFRSFRVLNVNQNQENSTHNPTLPNRPNTKKLYTLLKHSKQDSASVAPLKKDNICYPDDIKKATILNEQFQSVFSQKSPLSLKSLCTMKLQNLSDQGHNSPQECKANTKMHNIEISANDIEKLLKKP